MSINLHLKATREVYTKSGKPLTQTEVIKLLQTPTKVTDEILKHKTFEEQLNAYCEWAEQNELDSIENWEWWEIYDNEVRSKESYMNFDKEKERFEQSWKFPTDVYDDKSVVRVVLKGDPEFEEILNDGRDKEWAFLYHNEKENHLGVGYRLVAPKFNYQRVREKVEALKQEEYEFEFYGL
jgi:hypothetical protein